ncbi:MAG TPA: Na-translocating system protein MpsB, partial [Flavobacteriales bacterium]|nr:Na-translocating system protein MpsB [Flavobacteriales bacterium]
MQSAVVGSGSASFDEHAVLHDLKHYLPAQAPLKDFIHHNTLHAFQHEPFHDALGKASMLFGYKVYFTVSEYRQLHKEGKVRSDILESIIVRRHGKADLGLWEERVIEKSYDDSIVPRIGSFRANWKRERRMDLDAITHSLLFRVLNSYLDQGIAIWNFPVWDKGFLASVRELERNTWIGFFRKERAKKLLLDESTTIEQLLKILVGDERWYTEYLFDQQFGHSGWSGLVSTIEDLPSSLLDQRRISLKELVLFELLLEIDALDAHFPKGWMPLATGLSHAPKPLFAPVPVQEVDEVKAIFQEALEWTLYDEMLAGFRLNHHTPPPPATA